MGKPTDIRTTGAALYFLPVQARLPLKFGGETLTEVTCARACLEVADSRGQRAQGWGEVPLSVQWFWPSPSPYARRQEALMAFCREQAQLWAGINDPGHPLELAYDLLETVLPAQLAGFNRRQRLGSDPMPRLAALGCSSPFELALHDAYGNLHKLPTYDTYHAGFMNRDLAAFLAPAGDSHVSFRGKFPTDFLTSSRPDTLPAWHLVGGLDLLDPSELKGDEPNDGYPVLLRDWIQRDGLNCLKIKLRGTDSEWDFQRLLRVGAIADSAGSQWLSADFNCTVTNPAYVNEILDRLKAENPRIYGMILYVEQPFPYDLEQHRLDVHTVSRRKPLFLDESAHDWRAVRLGRELGWTGVALKTCKTQTGALLSGIWARSHGMSLMVQDLTNPMLAQIPHVLLAAHIGTIMGVETNAMQFYPEASKLEAHVHPGLYQRQAGRVDLSTVRGPGFGYQVQEIGRQLPPPASCFGSLATG